MYTNPYSFKDIVKETKRNVDNNIEWEPTINDPTIENEQESPQITIGHKMKEIYDRLENLKNHSLALNDFITDPVHPDDVDTHWSVDMSNVNNFFNAVNGDICILEDILLNILKRCY